MSKIYELDSMTSSNSDTNTINARINTNSCSNSNNNGLEEEDNKRYELTITIERRHKSFLRKLLGDNKKSKL